MKCNCIEWESGWPQLQKFLLYGFKYVTEKGIINHNTAPQFVYCPWCGYKLEEQ
jgi:hypothetical protein